MKFQMYKSNKEWRWRLCADNGKIIASGESYKRKDDCISAIALVCEAGLRIDLYSHPAFIAIPVEGDTTIIEEVKA